MSESFYSRLNRMLTWKRVWSFNAVLLVLLAIPLSVRLTQQSADTRSNAANNERPTPTPIPNYPKLPPKIDRVTLFYGKPGDTIVILGDNFGDYKWDRSKVYVGDIEAEKDYVVKWSNKIIEVQIPSNARTGSVWVSVDGKRAKWDGTLLLYNKLSSSEVGIEKLNQSSGAVWIKQGSSVKRGVVEIGYNSGNPSITAYPGVKVLSKSVRSDRYGNIQRIEFEVDPRLSGNKTPVLKLDNCIGKVEIVSMILRDQSNKVIDLFSNPLNVKAIF